MPSEMEGAKGPDLFKRILILALVLILETGMLGGINYWLAGKTNSQKSELTKQNDRIKELIDLSATKEQGLSEVSAFNQRVSALSDSLSGHIYWTAFFNWLEKNTKPTVVYQNFGGDFSSGIVTIDATAKNYREAAEQMVKFRDDPMVLQFRSSTLSASHDRDGKLSGINFTVYLKLKPEVWARPRAAAAASSESSEAEGEETITE